VLRAQASDDLHAHGAGFALTGMRAV
jgi:hypothetical protein